MTYRKRLIALLTLLMCSLAPVTQAGIYFEYAPDSWRSFRLATSAVATPSQFFQSATDFTLTGFSFWVDNTGSAGPVTFTVLDDENTTLTQETVTLGQTPSSAGGTRLRVELDEPVAISHYRTYSIQISSSLPGFGLYYANRINILEHNLEYTTEYALGVAKLGAEEQSYTFKFSLEDPTEGSTSYEEDETPPEEITPTSTGTQATVISNARVTSIAATTAIAAWTTNVAADSRVTVRSQLNPLNIYTTAYDDALELEHALLIIGLQPQTTYFVDFFSQQNPEEPILTTYSISFTTAVAPPAAPAAASTTPATSSTAATATSTSSQSTSTATGATTNTASTTSASANLSPVTFGPGAGSDSFTVHWNTPAGGAPNGGYRIDIFDEDHRLIRQLRAPGDATSRNVAVLPAGSHEVIVYADRNGVYEKVGAPTMFEAKKTRSPLFWFWYLMGVIFAVGIGFAFLFSRREKTELAPLE